MQALEEGIITPILDVPPEKRAPNRPGHNPSVQLARAFIIHGVEVAIKYGWKPPEACRLVADELKRAGYKIEGKTDVFPWKTIKSWRDEVSRLSRLDTDNYTLHVITALRQVRYSGGNKADAKKYLRDLTGFLVANFGRFGALDKAPT